MWRFLRWLNRNNSTELQVDRTSEISDGELFELFAPLREVEPDAAARSEGRVRLQAALVTARAERSRPRLASVRALTIAVAGLAGSSVLVASAATGTDPVALAINVADWSVPVWDQGAGLLFRESVTVDSDDPGAGPVEGTTTDGVPLNVLLPQPSADASPIDERPGQDARGDAAFEPGDDAPRPSPVTDVAAVSSPPPELARNPEPTAEPRPTRAPEALALAGDAGDPKPEPSDIATVAPSQPPTIEDRDETSLATVEPAPSDTNAGALDPRPTQTPTQTPIPAATPEPAATPKPTEPPVTEPTPGSATNLDASNDDGETDPDAGSMQDR